jgi:tetratricopeptide (TPR) repeat protein
MGKKKEGASDLQKAIQLDRNSEAANWNLAMVLIQDTKRLDAIPYLDHLIKLNPNNFMAILELATLQKELGNRKEVIRLCQQVLLNSSDESERQRAKQLIAN